MNNLFPKIDHTAPRARAEGVSSAVKPARGGADLKTG